jgi:hypothetical protein
VRASGAPARWRGRILAGSGIGSIFSGLYATVTHSLLPVIIFGSLVGLVILVVGTAVLVPIFRGAYPIVQCGTFKFSFEGRVDRKGPPAVGGGHRRT